MLEYTHIQPSYQVLRLNLYFWNSCSKLYIYIYIYIYIQYTSYIRVIKVNYVILIIISIILHNISINK